ncbi:hypothetical protein [Mycolicibacterium tokaiense]|uniref:Phage integrase family protein n=1 Tax=Mycolicibacterium tokaiense TaxID=39695 RepID=A0A378TIK7_9MYCO|nr:hypothetical protein [Mycolicibacterium tokaiense]BBY84854.1 hypothetical protein MTOK_06360 [Mycolicibacterium tokaiense]STZ60641.1 phage integrase family protein [Mycolicibacterium tokaiense]
MAGCAGGEGASGKLKKSTLEDNEALLQRYVLERFGARAIASITPRDAEDYLAGLVRQRSKQGDGDTLAPATVKHAWVTFNRVMKYALRHGAIISNPCDRVDYSASRATGDRSGFEHHPLTAVQVGALSAAVSGVTPADYIGPRFRRTRSTD